MSTGLTVYEGSKFLAIADQSPELQEAINAMAEVGEVITPQDLVRVRVPAGGVTKWTVESMAGDETTEVLRGVLCFIQRRGVLWPSEDAVEGTKPVLVSDDLLIARQVGPIPDDMIDVLERYRINDTTFNWKDLPYNQFGSSRNGAGKRCKEQRILYLLREGDIYPTMVVVPPGSLNSVCNFLKNQPQTVRAPYWHCVIELRLTEEKNGAGQKYSRIAPRLAGVLSASDAAVIKARFTDVLRKHATELSAVADE